MDFEELFLNRVAISIVSHGQGAQVELLLQDLSALAVGSFDLVILTINIDESVPEGFLTESHWKKLLIRNLRPKGFGANYIAAFEHACSIQDPLNEEDYWIVLNLTSGLVTRTAL